MAGMKGAALIPSREEWQEAKSAAEVRPFLRLIIENRSKWSRDKRARRFVEQGQRYIEARQWNEALAAYDRAIAIEPNYPWGNLFRAATLLWAGRAAEAVDAPRRAIELAPNLSWPHSYPYSAFIVGVDERHARLSKGPLDRSQGGNSRISLSGFE
jgi:tetratricopeptide (TPR) repeat protein